MFYAKIQKYAIYNPKIIHEINKHALAKFELQNMADNHYNMLIIKQARAKSSLSVNIVRLFSQNMKMCYLFRTLFVIFYFFEEHSKQDCQTK